MQGRLEWDGLWGPLQPNPFYDSVMMMIFAKAISTETETVGKWYVWSMSGCHFVQILSKSADVLHILKKNFQISK